MKFLRGASFGIRELRHGVAVFLNDAGEEVDVFTGENGKVITWEEFKIIEQKWADKYKQDMLIINGG